MTFESDAERAGATIPSAISVTNLRVRYRDGAIGVHDISINVGQGQVVALIGPNGAGKTTTVRAITGFLYGEGTRIIGGTVSVMGQNVSGWEPHRISRLGVAVVPERFKVFGNMTVAEHLKAVRPAPRRVSRKDDLDRALTLFPALAPRMKQHAGTLSGGEQQMLAICSALLTEPRVLLVDEMTLGLHPSLHAPLFSAIEAIAKTGTAILIVDESVNLSLHMANYCYLLSNGLVRAHGDAAKFGQDEMLAAGYVG